MTLDDALLAFYKLTEKNEGLPPTLREFVAECGMKSSRHAFYWFDKLRTAGLIYTPASLLNDGLHRSSRALQLSKAGRQRAYLLLDTELRIA